MRRLVVILALSLSMVTVLFAAPSQAVLCDDGFDICDTLCHKGIVC